MEQKVFEIINTFNCKYVFSQEDKKLMSIKPAKTVYDIKEGTVEQTFILGGEGEPRKIGENWKFYYGEQSFKEGSSLPQSDIVKKMTTMDVMEIMFRGVKNDNNGNGPFVWIFENGEATKWYFEERVNKVTIDHLNSGKTTMDCEQPEYYYDAEEVYQYNDYTVKNSDGTVTVREGVYRRLMLTDEQNKLVDKLQNVINECKKAGIQIDYELSDYHLVAYNAKDIEEIGYDPNYDDETEVAYHLELARAGRTIFGVGDVNTDDDYLKFIIKK